MFQLSDPTSQFMLTVSTSKTSQTPIHHLNHGSPEADSNAVGREIQTISATRTRSGKFESEIQY